MAKDHKQYGTLDVARMLGVSAMTVVRWIDSGLIRAFKTPGNHRRIVREDLKHFLRKMGFPMPPEFKDDKCVILAVDDEEDVLDVMTRAFLSDPDRYDVHQARDGVTALIEVGRVRPDVLLLDIVLPGMNGIEVCRKIHGNPHLSTSIVAISGKATPDMKEAMLKAGADLFLEKPVSIHTLRKAVAGLTPQ